MKNDAKKKSTNLSGKRILLIESNDSARNTIKMFLECQGAVVLTASRVEKIHGLIAGSFVSREYFNIILVEVRLPDCFDFFVLKRINESLGGFKIPIFVMSHGFSGFAIRQMIRYRVMGYIRKPFTVFQVYDYLLERLNFFSKIIIEQDKINEINLQIEKENRTAVPKSA